jgi:signal transduction histidine kinase
MLLALGKVSSQTVMNLDSLLMLYNKSEMDTTRVLLLINIGQQYEGSSPEKAKKYYEEAGSLSEELNYKRGTLKFISNYGYVLNMQGDYDASLELNLRSIDVSKDIGDSLALAKCLFNTGTSYQLLNNYESAVSYYLKGKRIFTKLNNEILTARSSDILQTLYQKLKRYDKAIELGEEAIELSRKNNLDYDLSNALSNISISYLALNQPGNAIKVLEEALQISRKTENKYLEVSTHLNFAQAWEKKLQFDTMEQHSLEARKLAVELGDVQSEGIAISQLSMVALYKNELKKANELAALSNDIFRENDMKREQLTILGILSNTSLALGNVRDFMRYNEQENTLSEQVLNENLQHKIVELEKKYENELKEEQIALLESKSLHQQLKIANKNILNIVLISLVGILILLVVLYVKNYKQKLILRQKRITELEIQQQLTATEAVLTGEEKERVRVAKDLHDGLGGLLSGIKFSFQNMKGNLKIPKENENEFNKGMKMLDTSIDEIRRIAHNMMPETLVKFGLDTAVDDFCSNIDQTGNIHVSYQSIGMKDCTLEQSKAINIYRIVQELVYNSLKHAQAKSIIVQLIKNDDNLSVTVEDDGIGFDPKSIEKNKGIGWSNINTRINFLKGKLDLQSIPGNGTSVQLTFEL